jgi:hypothetical protein
VPEGQLPPVEADALAVVDGALLASVDAAGDELSTLGESLGVGAGSDDPDGSGVGVLVGSAGGEVGVGLGEVGVGVGEVGVGVGEVGLGVGEVGLGVGVPLGLDGVGLGVGVRVGAGVPLGGVATPGADGTTTCGRDVIGGRPGAGTSPKIRVAA